MATKEYQTFHEAVIDDFETEESKARIALGEVLKKFPRKGQIILEEACSLAGITLTVDALVVSQMKIGKRDPEYFVAFYFWLHKKHNHLSYTDAIDKIVFTKIINYSERFCENDWIANNYVWELDQKPNKPFNEQLASFELSSTQSNDAEFPLHLVPSLFIRNLTEPEKGFKIGFSAVELVVTLLPDDYPAEFKRPNLDIIIEPEYWDNASFEVVSRKYSEIIRIQHHVGFLDGQYNMKQNTVCPILPKEKYTEFQAKLTVASDYENLICPSGIDIKDDRKRVILTQMILKGSLPTFGNSNELILHEATYSISAKEKNII